MGAVASRYRSKPQEVEAVQWTGDNYYEVVARFVPVHHHYVDRNGDLYLIAGEDGAQGHVPVPVGHWIVRKPGDHSDYWPVAPDYFAEKYEPLADASTG